MRKAYYGLALLLLAALIAIGAWRLTDKREASRADFLMGTYMEIRAIGRQAEPALTAVFARLAEIEARMTQNEATSEISAINRAAGSQAVTVSEDTFFVIQQALTFAQLTDGAFDPTIQPLVKLWQIGSPQARVPTATEIVTALPLVDYRAVELDSNNLSVKLARPGMGLDLGGIAKGYAADEAVRILREYGIKKALLDLGGNLYALGNSPSNVPWRIGIQDPTDERSRYVAVLEAENQTLVTSGAYERFLEVDGTVYHHILDPATGYPAPSELLSVTIVADTSIDADALSTSIYLLGKEAGLALLADMPQVGAILIDSEHRIYVSPQLQERLTVVDPRFELMP